MNKLYLCWLDDTPSSISSFDDLIEVLEIDFNCKITVDPHYDSSNFDTIARSLDNDVVFLIDYNLKKADGSGLDGHEVIKAIRGHNSTAKILFYSSKATQVELRDLIDSDELTTCCQREKIIDELQFILKERTA